MARDAYIDDLIIIFFVCAFSKAEFKSTQEEGAISAAGADTMYAAGGMSVRGKKCGSDFRVEA